MRTTRSHSRPALGLQTIWRLGTWMRSSRPGTAVVSTAETAGETVRSAAAAGADAGWRLASAVGDGLRTPGLLAGAAPAQSSRVSDL